ncbi:multiple inositol polyphosphate phosphatase 1-like [Plodia interpunctella]|uniref:multiple inositol polyphosphate phosphatase 1-like n=1 Tax=Plodia interpunctella TaxID=58824 RepID=UPI0023683DB5|nr:multiple inositol polyphosphate phosphatase 1-like [Plodia interpunctella]
MWLANIIVLMCMEQWYSSANLYKYFGGKTLYDDVRGDIRNASKLKGCEPVSIWLLSRHGTRNPSEQNLRDMKNALTLKTDIIRNHEEGRGELGDMEIKELREYEWNPDLDATPYLLITRGYKELNEYADRINVTYFSLLKRLKAHHIRPTNEQRTIESARSFVAGLDDSLEYEIEAPLDKKKDFMLLPYLSCDLHTREAWNVTKRLSEIRKYYQTAEFQEVLASVQKRLGIQAQLSPINVTGLYNLCWSQRSTLLTGTSPWCKLFTNRDLEVLEYIQDINSNLRSGYGFPFNGHLGRLVLSDLLKKFQAEVYNTKPTFTAFFAHDSLIDMVYCALGLFHDENGIDAKRRNPHRKWRSSKITPFAANILAVLHKCRSS